MVRLHKVADNIPQLYAVYALALSVGKIAYRCCYRQYGLLNENLTKNRNKNAKENFKRMGKVRFRFG